MTYTLKDLPYSFDALEPQIDAKTMEIHHDKHHNAYITNLNAALDKYPDLKDKDIKDLLADIKSVPEDIRTAVRNNGGGHANHSLFWETLAPASNQKPGSALAKAIDEAFGSFDEFKTEVDKAAKTRFGSGWAWLVLDDKGALKVYSTANQDSPYMENHTPLLGIDVWEHAYYLNYQNKRPDYIQAWFEVINWEKVDSLYEDAKA